MRTFLVGPERHVDDHERALSPADDGATDDGMTDDTATDGATGDDSSTDGTATDGTATDGAAADDTAADGTDMPAESIAITYTCGNGESGDADAPTPNMEELDDVVNTIDFCEGREGLVSVAFTAACPSGDRDVTVEAVDGGLPDIATLDLCENEG